MVCVCWEKGEEVVLPGFEVAGNWIGLASQTEVTSDIEMMIETTGMRFIVFPLFG